MTQNNKRRSAAQQPTVAPGRWKKSRYRAGAFKGVKGIDRTAIDDVAAERRLREIVLEVWEE